MNIVSQTTQPSIIDKILDRLFEEEELFKYLNSTMIGIFHPSGKVSKLDLEDNVPLGEGQKAYVNKDGQITNNPAHGERFIGIVSRVFWKDSLYAEIERT